MMPEVVRFSCCDHPFRVSITRCADFECECTELYFSLREVTNDGGPIPEGRTLEVRVDGDTWQEIDAPPRDVQSEQMVRELLDGYPATGKEHLQQDVREKRRAVHRLRNFRFDPDMIAEGTLVAFGEIISDRRRGAKVWSFAYDWEHDGDYYLLEDLYCCNPTCPCRDVHVSFFRCSRSTKTQRKPVTEEQFVAILSLDGKWRIGNCYKCSEAKAKELLRAWRQDEPDHLENFRWRHDKVKEIARRTFGRPMLLPDESPLSFEAALEPPLEPPIKPPLELADDEPDEEADGPVLTREVRVGRNEPCPCGSGKKYKKCCGKGGPPRE